MCAVLMLTVFAVAVPDRQDPAPRQATAPEEQIIGDWLCLNETGGIVHTFRITRTESFWTTNGQPSPQNGLTADIVLDASKNPATIDFKAKHVGAVYSGIWKVEGDQLILAFQQGNGDSRPTEFVASANLHRFKRIK
jgi:uncharacterized protein (TIGR03067 family)